jgi:hypothetical protein
MKTSIRLRSAALRLTAAIGVLTTLSACGAVELMASGISDGTKYVIRKVEEGRQGETRAPGTIPAAAPVQAASPAPVHGTDATVPPVTAAPVTPVSRGEPL